MVEVRDVEKSFGRLRAVDGISLNVRPGEMVALLGPNGAGKTTLLRMIIGMLQPDRGSVRYRDGGVESNHPSRDRLGYLPEERGLYQDVSVERILLYFAALRGMPRSDARREAHRWLERLELSDRAKEELRNLSKGNQQKVQFIASIVHRPSLAVLDEPFSGLDPLNQDLFLDLIRELRADGSTIVFSAHQMQLVERLADRVLLIRRGRVAAQGTLDELRERWHAGRRLRVRFDGAPDVSFLDSAPGVMAVERTGSDELEIALVEGASLSGLLEMLGRNLEVRDLHAEAVTLHDIYVRSVGAEEMAQGEVAA
jgi:ABC-2 type transport system ATP-binding protein